MIEVIIRHKESKTELGRIEIENLTDGDGDYADYSIRFGVERIGAVGIHQRSIINFPRKQFNVLALVRQALKTLEPEELKFDGEYHYRSYGNREGSLLRRMLGAWRHDI
ncbi:MAG: hypothetical protein [Phage AS32]|nr:MAG: hypothetical protein [Phage AS32]